MVAMRLIPLAALLLVGGCAYDYADSYAPSYPPGYDSGMGSGQFSQPGDLFGGQNVSSIEVFYGPLAPYGGWVDSRYGRAFRPNVARDWRPYVNGRWGENRLWMSNDPWGWATDHYGRWGFDDRLGYVWVPGVEWAPSWVAWREADDVAGWAPIPPGINYSVGVGFGSGWGYDNWNSWYAPSWVWVPRSYLYQPGFGGGVLPWNNGFNYWRGSHWNYATGWNGRPGYGAWNGRPGYNGVYGRPGYNGGYGRPGYNGGNGRPGYIGGNGRPGNDRPDGWNGRPPGYDRADAGNGRPGYGRPDGWEGGRRVDDRRRPENGGWQGGERPEGSRPGYQGGDRTPAQGYPGGRPNRGEGNGGGYRNPGRQPGDGVTSQPIPVAMDRPPRAERPPTEMRAERPPPQARAERPPAPPRQPSYVPPAASTAERFEQPQ